MQKSREEKNRRAERKNYQKEGNGEHHVELGEALNTRIKPGHHGGRGHERDGRDEAYLYPGHLRHAEQIVEPRIDLQDPKAEGGRHPENSADHRSDVHGVPDGSMNAFSQQGIERAAQRKGKVVAIGKVGKGQANKYVNGPAVHPPMEKGGVHGKAGGLGRLAVNPFRRRRSKMQQRLRDPEKEQPDADAGAKQHGKPGKAAIFRLRVIGA